MCSAESLREFVKERLTAAAAAEEILGAFKRTIVEYEEEIDRQRRLLDIVLKPEIKLHRTELPQQHVCKEEEVVTEQQLCTEERKSSVDQEEPEPPQIKEEEEEVCSSQEREQLVVKQETDGFMLTPADEESEHSEDQTLDFIHDDTQSAAEKESVVIIPVISYVIPSSDHQLLSHNSVEYLREFVKERLTVAAEDILGVFKRTIVAYEEEIDRQRRLLDIVLKPEIKLHRTELPQQHVCKEEEVVTEQQLCTEERKSSVDQEEPEPPQIKEEEEEVCSSQEREQLVVKQETDGFMLTPADEESEHSEDQTLDFIHDDTQSAAEKESVVIIPVISYVIPSSDHQLLSHNSVEYLREFVKERLTAAAEDILGVFKRTIVAYEEEIDRQRRLLDIV
ncbi:uncharacterized protein LOC125887286 [Epinephelus fuscoguttatus]|uniref:uncharacterized protein LOC125887286 n=1 Tax=Epinephelus fuscoguttatus TaxID=293821 RepID=UPI0020D068DC|nr:uncharacterized protein LOC125887286 [Epinephelus fuscoguttatus]